MSNAVGIILIIMIGVLVWVFAQLVAGRKKGDAQIIKRQAEEIKELKYIRSVLRKELEEEHLRNEKL